MVPALIIAVGLVAVAPPGSPPLVAEEEAYQAARAEARRDPDAHVRLALWCEAHGMPAERLRHLALAILAEPKHATARGLLGLVAHADRWRKPAEVQAQIRADAELTARLAEYNGKRAGSPNTADAQWDLGLWCEQHGLDAEATAHFTAVTRLDPGREAAWKRLGYTKHDGRWMTDAQVAAREAEANARKAADRRWGPLLEKARADLNRPEKRAEADALLIGVTDPRAVPSIWRVFAAGSESDQARAARILGQIDAPTASRALALLAVRGASAEVRRIASETLIRRDARDYADLLIGLLREPIRYQVKPVGGPGLPGQLLVEGKAFDRNRIYAPPGVPNIPVLRGDRMGLDAAGLPVINRPFGPVVRSRRMKPDEALEQMLNLQSGGINDRVDLLAEGWSGFGGNSNVTPYAGQTAVFGPGTFERGVQLTARNTAQIPVGQMAFEARRSAEVAQRQLEGDVAAIDQANDAIRRSNDRILPILRELAGQDLGEDLDAWKRWYTDLRGYAYQAQRYSDRPTVVETVPLAYRPQVAPITFGPPQLGIQSQHSCFGAGTSVLTLGGPRPIESIEAGDRVLTQDTTTGALSYRPILAVYHNRPAPTLRITLGGESIVATPIHRFWRAGRGWAMARDLRPGDAIRTLGGLAEVEAVADDAVQPVFNLEVAEGRSFFAGGPSALVHDNSLVEPVLEPFDAPPALAKAEGGGGSD